MKKILNKFDWLLISVVAFSYYAFLCAKEWTWCFVSGDSGDWLAGSIWWMNVQPYGSPLYISLGHLLNGLFPDNLVVAMTIGLSVIPASVTVGIVYLIVKKLTGKNRLAIAGSIILLASSIFLSQATVLEEYAISAMFLTLAYYFYICDKKRLTLLMLGLGSAVHIIVVVISFIWLCFSWKDIKKWYRSFWVYGLVGVLPYVMVLVLMASDTPKLIAGDLTLENINNYLGSSSTIGSISWYEAIFRLPVFIGFVVVNMGMGVIAFIKILRDKPYQKHIRIALASIIVGMWLYFTNIDPSTWTFMSFCMPLVAVMIAIGLGKLNSKHYQMVVIFAVFIIALNSVWLNANVLTQTVSNAKSFETECKALPNGSAIVETSGGAYGLGTIYVMAQGKDIIPVYYSGNEPVKQDTSTARYDSYKKWLNREYGIVGEDTVKHVEYCLQNNVNVYIVKEMVRPSWQGIFVTEDCELRYFEKVVGVNEK